MSRSRCGLSNSFVPRTTTDTLRQSSRPTAARWTHRTFGQRKCVTWSRAERLVLQRQERVRRPASGVKLRPSVLCYATHLASIQLALLFAEAPVSLCSLGDNMGRLTAEKTRWNTASWSAEKARSCRACSSGGAALSFVWTSVGARALTADHISHTTSSSRSRSVGRASRASISCSSSPF